MKPEDQKRIERQAEIWLAKRGATPSLMDQDIARNHAVHADKVKAGQVADQKRYGWSPELDGEALRDYQNTRGRGR